MPTILVVEDEFFIREFVCEEVAAAGFSVLEAPNADVALIALEGQQNIHLLFTDIDMPGTLDGLQLAALVRRRWPPMKIVIASGKRTPRSDEMPPQSTFLPKPYMPSDIVGVISRSLGAASGHAAN